jgi:thymidylate synthase
MHIKVRNVNDAFKTLVGGIHLGEIETEKRSTRYGETLTIPEPVIVTYSNPKERVLLSQARDCNPFLHLYESLYMLAGRNDVAPLKYYCSKIDEFSDDGKIFNGSYGYRWRFAEYPQVGAYAHVDQLRLLVEHLKSKPNSRRAILQHWNIQDDLLKIDTSKDTCCNLCVKFSIREVKNPKGYVDGLSKTDPPIYHSTYPKYLDMTVFNRSNDLILGLLGTNVVTFSILQEYMAAQLGIHVGVYNQISDDVHVYLKTGEPEKWLSEYTEVGVDPHYLGYPYNHVSLVKNPNLFDSVLPEFVEMYHSFNEKKLTRGKWNEPFLDQVAAPMFKAFAMYKEGKFEDALNLCKDIEADDWRLVATNWIKKREAKRLGKPYEQ